MGNVLKLSAISLILSVLTTFSSGSADISLKSQPVTHLEGYLVTSKAGHETITPLPLAAATLQSTASSPKAVPGSILEYQITFSNPTGHPLSGANIQGIIPAGTQYLENSARPANPARLEYSIDGGRNWDRSPVQRMRRNKDGRSVLTIIPPTEYTHLRWQASTVKPGSNKLFKYRVQVH